MPYVPPEMKERIKREVSIQRLAEARGIKLRRSGKELIGLCPFHKDTNPSLNIDPVQNVWHCKGACGEGGDVIEWVRRAEGVSFSHAVELLKRDYLPSAASSAGPPPKQSTVPKLPPLIEHTPDDKKLLEIVVSYYHETLKTSPEAQQYLIKRELKSAEMLGHFRLGFANRTLGYRLPASNRIAGEEQRGRLQRLGIYRESGHEHFNGSLVIPIFDLNGEVLQMYGRKISRMLREGTPEHLYLPGPHRGVWNEEALVASKEIILCEALIDALTFWCAGYRHVTTSYGVNGFTSEIKAAFRKHGTKKIYIAYDRDQAGETAAQAHGEELMQMGIECFRVQFPKNMDANEYARKMHPAPKALGVMLNSAAWLGKGKRPVTTVIQPAPPAEPQIIQPQKIKIEEPVATAATADPPIILAAKMETTTLTTPIPAAQNQHPQPAAKEENAISLPASQATAESVPSLAADPESEQSAEAPRSAPLPSVLAATVDVPTEIKGEEIVIWQGERRYRIRGLGKNMSYELLRVNVLASHKNLRGENGFHVDTLDLYSARQRTVFIKQASEEMGVKEEIIRRDLGRVLLKLEELQDEQIKKALEPEEKEFEISAEEKAAAMALLRDPRLLDRIITDFERCGVVGEETNKLVGYLAVISRMLEAPLAVIVQSMSAAGKSALMESVLAFVPDEQRVQYSAMTGQSLFYMGETDLKNKVLAIVEEEGAQRAAYALKLLQSEGVLTIASTGKDPVSGRLTTQQYRVEGPVMIFLTTTAIDVDEELLNRCLVLTVNEDREQTQAIHRMQREAQTLEGLLRKRRRDEVLALHRNAQRLLKPIFVVNPYAPELTFTDSQTRTRRDHMKYLTLIRTIALLHQHQRQHKTVMHSDKPLEYIEATISDIEKANDLTKEVLGRSLDELPPQTRRLLLLIDEMVSHVCEEQKIERTEARFSRRDVRQFTNWGNTQLKMHLHRLEELEYLLVHHGGRGQSFVYELLFAVDPKDGRPMLHGLIDVGKLKGCVYDANRSGTESEKSGSSRPHVGPVSGDGRDEESPANTQLNDESALKPENRTTRETDENPVLVTKKKAVGVK
jgi:DNA primase catalytic core